MDLYHREFGGEGTPLIVLHGLLGSSRNWMAAGKDLAERFRPLAPDLRNHGNSPHAPTHDFAAMCGDVTEWLDARGLQKVFLMGHSMGGKVAMRLACRQPERTRALVVVDISPAEKEPSYRTEISALHALPLDEISSRSDADQWLAKEVPDQAMRQFLLTNLVRKPEGGWGWQSNLEVLASHLAETGKKPVEPDERFTGPALFVLGEDSGFVTYQGREAIREHFPSAKIEEIPGAGHNPHVEARSEFVRIVSEFLESH